MMIERKNIVRWMRFLAPVLLLGAAVGLAAWFVKTKPTPKKRTHEESASVVDTLAIAAGHQQVTLAAMGTVSPVVEIMLQAEVTGLIVWKHPNLVPGGMVQEGETLLRVDARNYDAVVTQQEAAMQRAEVEYQLELSRSEVAKAEWQLMNPDGDADPRARTLTLREPQLRAAQAAVRAASNAVFRARLDVGRTRIVAPFNAVVLDEFVDSGQVVSPLTRLAQLAGTDVFRVKASLPVRDLQWMNWPDANGAGGPAATISYDIGEGKALRFEGAVTRVMSGLGSVGRMAHVLVDIRDPLRLSAMQEKKRKERLFVGAYVRVLLDGIALDDVYTLPESVIREGNKIWIMNADSRLEIRDVEVIRRQGGKALVKRGLMDGERVVSSHIPAPIPGMKLRAKKPAAKGSGSDDAGGRRHES